MRSVKRHLMETLPFALVIILLTAGACWRNRLWNDEIALWTDCAKKSPRKARVYVNLGSAFFNAGIYDKAQETAQKAIEIDPKFAEAYFTLSTILQKMGDPDKAIEMAKKSLDIDPKLHQANYFLGGIYFQKGQYEESAEALRRFLKVFPYFPEGHHFLGIVYASQKQFAKGVSEFERELRVNPYHTLAHLNLGQIYWHEFHNREKALYHFKAALALDPLLPDRKEIRRLVRQLEGLS
jgi:tetratricopeptide (TPR) repeat protein